jgi:iron complex transport system substrate-binding protein
LASSFGIQRRGHGCIAAWLLFGLTFGLAPAAEASLVRDDLVRDDLGRDVRFAQPPQRIITLLPSITETVCALGDCDRLVATDRYSNWPAAVRALPKAGGLDDAEIELIVSLKPDLVILSRSQRITDRLGDLGIASLALETDRYGDIEHNIDLLGRVLGVPERATRLEAAIAAQVRAIGETARAARGGEGARVYFEVDRTPYAAGPTSFIGELLTRVGARNIVTADLGAFPKLNPEYVVRYQPDVIFVSAADAATLAERPGWDQLRAVKERRYCSFPPEINDILVRPGPRVAEGMQAIADCLRRVAP